MNFIWPRAGIPIAATLMSLAPLHPVKLTHRSGHAHVLNSLALQQAGITAETGDPPEGFIDRELTTGEPTGILYGMGAYLSGKIPFVEDAEIERGLGAGKCKTSRLRHHVGAGCVVRK